MRRDILLNTIAGSPFVTRRLRRRILRRAGMNVASTVLIHPRCWFGNTKITIGDGTWINYGTWFDNCAPITLGRNVNVGQGVMFCTSKHEIGPPERRAGRDTSEPITIGDGSWIGSRALILGGVTVGAGCVIAAGAVVTADCAPNGIYAGVPARRIRDIDASSE